MRLIGLAVVLSLILAPVDAQASKLVMETLYVAARDPGIQLHVRNKRPNGVTSFAPERIVLFVHGATYPSETGLPRHHTVGCD